jgi:hypothetical protein
LKNQKDAYATSPPPPHSMGRRAPVEAITASPEPRPTLESPTSQGPAPSNRGPRSPQATRMEPCRWRAQLKRCRAQCGAGSARPPHPICSARRGPILLTNQDCPGGAGLPAIISPPRPPPGRVLLARPQNRTFRSGSGGAPRVACPRGGSYATISARRHRLDFFVACISPIASASRPRAQKRL